MRKDVLERMILLKKEGIKPNYAQLAQRFGCDYRTVKRYFEEDKEEVKKPPKPSKLDDYKAIIEEKLDIPCTIAAIYKFIQKRGYQGRYTILRDYCRQLKTDKQKKATIRFETNPGMQAQIDWKESMRLYSKNGELFEINIFLILLGYSRYKYIELTINRNQDTLFGAIVNAVKFFGGVPKEMLFDNMKTVVDHKTWQSWNRAGFKALFYKTVIVGGNIYI